MNRREWIWQAAAIAGLSKVAAAEEAKQWAATALTAEQNATLTALGERIVPGSADALCNRLIDLVLPMESDKNRSELLNALAAFDRAAQGSGGKSFSELAPSAQDEILTLAAQENAALSHEFHLVKEWIADAYWSSERGMRELGYTGRMAWTEFPNCPSAQPHN